MCVTPPPHPSSRTAGAVPEWSGIKGVSALWPEAFSTPGGHPILKTSGHSKSAQDMQDNSQDGPEQQGILALHFLTVSHLTPPPQFPHL